MKRFVFTLIVAFFWSASLYGEGEVINEEAIMSRIRRYSHREHPSSSFGQRLLTACGGESNRIVRAAKLLCARNEGQRETGEALRMIGKFGTTNDLSYLDLYVTNEVCGCDAVNSYFQITGLTKDALERMQRYHAITNGTRNAADLRGEKMCLLVGSLYQARETVPRPPIWTNLFEYSYNYVSNNVTSSMTIDWWMLELRPEYRFTKRRLALMRWVLQNTEHPFWRAKTQEIIDELVAYPESNLPE